VNLSANCSCTNRCTYCPLERRMQQENHAPQLKEP
jgi:biotin synthase-like enzyme